MPCTNALFKKIKKISERVSRVELEMPNSVILEAKLFNEFSSIVDIYRRLKMHHRIHTGYFLDNDRNFLHKTWFSRHADYSDFRGSHPQLSYHICPRSMIKTMQRNLYQIWLKSLVGLLDGSSPQGEDSGVK